VGQKEQPGSTKNESLRGKSRLAKRGFWKNLQVRYALIKIQCDWNGPQAIGRRSRSGEMGGCVQKWKHNWRAGKQLEAMLDPITWIDEQR